MTLLRKVNLAIILCVALGGTALCIVHWVKERRAAHEALEKDGRWLASLMSEQLAALSPPNDIKAIQTIIGLACRWRPEIIEVAYYISEASVTTAVSSSVTLRQLTGVRPVSPDAKISPYVTDAFRKDKVILKRRYHDEEPHVAIYVPVRIAGKPYGILHLRLSPELSIGRVKTDTQRFVNATILVCIITIIALSFMLRFLIVGRVEYLAQAANRGAGEELERLGKDQPDEIGRLAYQINQMLRSILSRNIVWERLYTASVQEENAFRSSGQLADTIADEAELAARDRLERELEIANRIQRSLLPETFPTNHGLSFAVRYAPAGQVGGDLYDFVIISPDMLGIMIADVAGHGIPAAFVAGMTKLAFTQFAMQNPSPAAVVKAINDYLHSHLRTGHYVTIFYGIYNRQTHKFQYVRAGHQIPYVLRKDPPAIEALEKGGPLVGAEPTVNFEQSEVILREGDKIVMFTDGLAECKNEAGGRLGQEGIREILRTLTAQTAEETAAAIYRKATEFRGSNAPEDDITILVAQVSTPIAT